MSETFERERLMAEIRHTLARHGVAADTADGKYLVIQLTNVAIEAYRNGFRSASVA